MIHLRILIALTLLLLSDTILAQWQSDIRLTNAMGRSYTSSRSISVTGEILHVVWADERDGNWEIYYKASDNGGATWSPDGRLTNNSAESNNPAVWVSGPDVHVVWTDGRDGNFEIYYKRSTNGGFSWESDRRLTNNTAASKDPSISVAGLIVHVVWTDERDGIEEIYYKASADGGVTWSPDARLTNNSASSRSPKVYVSGPDVHVVWYDERDGNLEIYYKHSTNGGFSWGPDVRLTNYAGDSWNPEIAVTGKIVHIVWTDRRDVNILRIFYKASADGGVTWSPDISLTESHGGVPSIFVSGPDVHVVWADTRDANWEIYHKISTNGGFSWGDDIRLTNNSSYSYYPSVAVSGSKIHVVWTDERETGNMEVYYKRNLDYLVGIPEQHTGIPNEFSLSQNYPNPFNASTTIQFDLPVPSKVRLMVYDSIGREVTTIFDRELAAGAYRHTWESRGKSSTTVSSGIYFIQLTATSLIDGRNFNASNKVLLLK
jgi:hypothetical protein